MTLVRSKPSGYGPHDKFTYVEAEILDSEIVRALDSNGGTYILNTADLILGGSSDVIFNCDIATNGDFACDSIVVAGAFVAGALGLATFSGPVNFSSTLGDVNFTNSAVIVNGPVLTLRNNELLVEATSAIVSQGTTSFTGNNTFDSGSTDFGGGAVTPINFNANSTVDFKSGCSLIVATPVQLSAAGHVTWRLLDGVDADHTYSIADADIIRIPAVSALRIYKIDTAGASNGDTMEFYIIPSDTTNITEIQRMDGTPLVDLKNAGGASKKWWAKIVFSATAANWELSGYTQLP